jgi:glycogen synthase
MKIAQITHKYLPHIGGLEFYVKRVADSSLKKGIDTAVLATNSATPEQGRKPEACYFKTSFEVLRNPISIDFIDHLKKNQYDVLHLHSVWFFHCLIAVLYRRKARVISTIHGVYPDDAGPVLRLFLKLYKPFAKFVLSKSELIFVYSAIEQEKLRINFNIPSYKVHILPMAIHVEDDNNIEKDDYILFTGRIIPDKNPDLLIKAAANLGPEYHKYKLVYVGSISDQYKQELLQLAGKLNVKNEIRFEGQLDPSIESELKTLMNYYRRAKVFVSLGSWEGQPTRLMEAMQFKTPVIAFSAGGTADFVSHGQNGLVIQELSAKELSEKLNMVLSNPEEARRMGEEARAKILHHHKWDDIYETIYRAYQGSFNKS